MTMFLVGGGPDEGLDEVHDEFVTCARKHGNQIAVCLLGPEDEVGSYLPMYIDPIKARWPEVEILPVWLSEPDEQTATTGWPAEVEQLAGIVIAGGWTPGYLNALSPHRDEIARLVRRDIPYLGYSAGAAIAAHHAYVGGWRQGTQQVAQEVLSEGIDQVEVRDGLALVSLLVGVHNDAWSADGVIISLLESGPARIAVSIDERTALMVDPISGRTSPMGHGRVRWFTRETGGVLVRTELPPPPRPEPRPIPGPPVPHP